MINLAFTASQREIVRFVIDGRKVTYYDKVWKQGLQIYPMDKLLVKKLILSRKKSLSAMGLLIVDSNQGKNLEEYESCKTEEDISEMIRKEGKLKGLREIR